MSEPYDVTRPADRAQGLRRYVDRTGREWTEPRPGLKANPPAIDDRERIPTGFKEVTIKAYTDGESVVIEEQEGLWLPDESDHNCDENSCGWVHVLARFRLPRPMGDAGS